MPMPKRDGFIIDDRPDTQAVRCMKDCKQGRSPAQTTVRPMVLRVLRALRVLRILLMLRALR